MKPKYFFRKINFLLYSPSHAEWKKNTWLRLRNKDCVMACLKEKNLYYNKIVVVFDFKNNVPLVFAKSNFNNLLYVNSNVDDANNFLSRKDQFCFEDKDLLLRYWI